MIDQENEGQSSGDDTREDDALIGRPDWSARESASSEDEDDDWMMEPPSGPTAANPTTDAPQIAPSDTTTDASTASEEDSNRFDPARFDLDETDEDKGENDIAADASQAVIDAGHRQDDAPTGTHSAKDGDELHEEYERVTNPTGSEDHESAPVAAREKVELDPKWEAAASRTIGRWSDLSERHSGREAFKTGLVLPLLNALGYDTFDPDQVEPLEDDSGQHDGYLAKSSNGELVVLLADTEVADDHRDKVSLRTRRDRVTVGIRIPNEDGEGTRWQAVIEVHLEDGASVAPLSHVHRDAFDPAEISSMAHQMHGQQEHILEAMRRVIMAPGSGFVEDVRRMILSEGHGDPAMLSERMALLASKVFTGDEEDEIEDDDKTRQITPAEQQALEHIRRICGPEIAAERIVGRPAQAYLAVLLDDNNRRTIARLHFSAASRKHIGVFTGREETRHAIGGPADVGEYTDELRRRAKELDPDAFPDVPDDED